MTRIKQVTVGADIEVFVARRDPRKATKPPTGKKYDRKMRPGKVTWTTTTEAHPVDTDGNPVTVEVPPDIPPLDVDVPPELVLGEEALMDAVKAIQMVYKPGQGFKTTKPREKRRPAQIIPCVGLIPGTKDKPFTPKSWPEGYAVQEDNVMLEFNIPPVKSAAALQGVMMTIRKLVGEMCLEQDLVPMWNKPEHLFLPTDLTSSQATIFACDPDLDAYTGGTQRMMVPDFGCVRTCGGHIHLGGDFNCPDFVAVLFLELLLSLYLGGQFIHDPKSARAKWYGRPGVFRIKPYGIEYRTLSNTWASSKYGTSDIAHIVFTIGNMLVETPANILQAAFRSIEWTELHDLLLNPYISKKPMVDADEEAMIDESSKYGDYGARWSELRRQVQSLNVPGLQL